MTLRFRITAEALAAVVNLGPPRIITTVDLEASENLLPEKDRESFRDAFHKHVNHGEKMPRRMRAALDCTTGFRYRKFSTEEFSVALAKRVQSDMTDNDGYGGCRLKVGKKSWRILDTYGDEDHQRGDDLLYTLCAIGDGKIVVAEMCYDPELGGCFVRNEAAGKVEAGITIFSKRAFIYNPVDGHVLIRTDSDKYTKIKVE